MLIVVASTVANYTAWCLHCDWFASDFMSRLLRMHASFDGQYIQYGTIREHSRKVHSQYDNL